MRPTALDHIGLGNQHVGNVGKRDRLPFCEAAAGCGKPDMRDGSIPILEITKSPELRKRIAAEQERKGRVLDLVRDRHQIGDVASAPFEPFVIEVPVIVVVA